MSGSSLAGATALKSVGIRLFVARVNNADDSLYANQFLDGWLA